MPGSEYRSSSARAGSPPPEGDESGIPLITWAIGGVAFIVVLTAGAVFLDAKPGKEVDEAQPEQPPQSFAPGEIRVQDLAPKNPLEITASLLDAQERGKLWSPSATLSRLELVVQDGKPSGPITFEFGEPIGPSVPGTPLSAARLTLSYEGVKVETSETDSPTRRVALPEPNCPLEVAFRKLTETGVSTQGRMGILYLQSEKHGRPVWLVTDASGQAISINAETCALLRR